MWIPEKASLSMDKYWDEFTHLHGRVISWQRTPGCHGFFHSTACELEERVVTAWSPPAAVPGSPSGSPVQGEADFAFLWEYLN